MTSDEILSNVRDAAVEVLGVEPEAVVESAQFAEDLEADSLDLVELVMALEDALEIEIPEEELEEVVTVGDAVRLIEAKTGAGA